MLFAIWVLLFLTAGIIYPLKLDKRLPQLPLLQVLLLLFIARALDFTTFLIATGGRVAAYELSPVYQFLLRVSLRGGVTICLIHQLIAVLLAGGILSLLWRCKSRRWGSRRGALTWAVVATSFSFAAAYVNVTNGILN